MLGGAAQEIVAEVVELLQESGENINTAAAATAQVFGSKFRGSDCLSSATVTVGQKRTKSAVRERIET